MRRFVSLVVLLLIGVTLPAQTYKEWKIKSETGDYEARCQYAYMTFLGDGCKSDEEKGRYLLEELRSEYLDTSKAAYLYAYTYLIGQSPDEEMGISILKELLIEDNIYAYRKLVDLYLQSNYKNVDSARYYIDRLIAKNDAYGWHIKGLLQLDGQIYTKNVKEGILCLEKSVSISNQYSCKVLGNIYQYGEHGVAIDKDKACEYYYKAPELEWNTSDIQLSLASIYLERKQVDSILLCGNRLIELGNNDGYFLLGSAARAKDNVEQMLENYEQGAKNGNSMCLEALGSLYKEGEKVERNIKKAIKYYEEANTVVGSYSLGKMLMMGESGETYQKGLSYLKKSAANGYDKAIYDLAYLYEYGSDRVKINYDSAMLYLRASVEMGNAKAMYIIGKNYEYGRGVEMNNDIALEYYRKASQKGNDAALCSLGEYFRLGKGGLNQDCDSAYNYYQKAVSKGFNIGSYYIGCCYLDGCGVGKDTSIAITYFKQLIKLEENDIYDKKLVGNAYSKLGSIYNEYSFVKSIDSSMIYYQKAVSNGSGEGCYELGMYLLKEEGNVDKAIEMLAKGITLGNVDCMIVYAENLNQNALGNKDMLKESYKLYETVALDYNDARGYVGMGLSVMNGEGCVKNEPVGVAYLEKAAKMGNASGQYYAGMAYLTGIGCEIDVKSALQWINKSANQDDTKALNMLGNLYLDGTLVKRNAIKGFEYYKYAAEKLGSLEAYCNMGVCYEKGIGVPQDVQKAFVSYQMAAQYNYPKGQCLLGNSYRDGIFVAVDINEAFKWYKLAVEQGYGEASYYIGEIYDKGIGIEVNKKLAKEYFQKAISLGYMIDE